ncbi:MAG TPA: hypothetical protein PLI97_00600 [Fluviicola sp.]|mgnify:CR=1 FL=1|nr:hypothetical protein [Fluviicola sp.]
MRPIIYTLLLTSGLFFSCKKTRNCECKYTWDDYTEWGVVKREKTVAFPLKDTKANAKKECEIINTNQNVDPATYVSCELK